MARTRATSGTALTSSLNTLLGYGFGAVYLLVGLVGFAVTSGVGFAAHEGHDFLFFELNPLHNIIHIAIGVLLAGAAYIGRASAANTLVGAVYAAVGVVGLFLTSSDLNILALNHPDNFLHLATATVLLGVGLSRK
ncbi:DUF4383 domain-containing protein [Streptosporangiaceae bacterium NEAU-GS5]|nr:DUF4383 domain-containing protein [Streptosporangiaceae bacterium NEAU-GS5]